MRKEMAMMEAIAESGQLPPKDDSTKDDIVEIEETVEIAPVKVPEEEETKPQHLPQAFADIADLENLTEEQLEDPAIQ